MMKLAATTNQISVEAFSANVGLDRTVIAPIPNNTALTIGKIIAAIHNLVRMCLLLLNHRTATGSRP